MQKPSFPRIVLVSLSFFLIFSFLSCKSAPKEIKEDISEAELLQMGQSAIDESKYKLAEYYYKEVISRFGSRIEFAAIAEYEIAHMKIKRKHFKEAKPMLEKILAYYEDEELAPQLPPSYKKLAKIDLAKCK